MTSTQSQEMLAEATKFADDLISCARSDIAAKLQAVDEACRSIIDGGGTVSITSVRGWLVTNRGINIAPSTLMNRRTDPQTGDKTHSPSRLIINKYIEIQKVATKRVSKKIKQSFGSIALSESEMKEIEDHQVRYKVQLLAGRVRNLETQLNHVRTINSLPVLTTAGLSQSFLRGAEDQTSVIENSQNLRLDEEELDALNDFLKKSSMRRRKVEFDNNGTLKITHPASSTTSTAAISKPFLEGALHKILRSYGRV